MTQVAGDNDTIIEYHTLTLVMAMALAYAHECAIIITSLRLCANELTAFMIISKGKYKHYPHCYEHNNKTEPELVDSLIETQMTRERWEHTSTHPYT